jgi:dolichol-phosphate mannosyltransferase
VSLVIPCHNEADNVPVLLGRVLACLPSGYDYEVLFVDDGSTDDTLRTIKKAAERHDGVRFISFSRRFGHQAALRAGIREATGDCVISMDADLQHPPELLPTLIDRWEAGAEIVYTRRNGGSETGTLKRHTSRAFYRIMNRLSGLAIDEGAADFRLLDRKVVDVINALPEPHLFIRGFVTWCGFTVSPVDYHPAARLSGKSKYTMREMLKLALQGITQFSIKPLRLANVLGFISACAGLIYGIVAACLYLFGDHRTVSGWTSVIVSILVIGGVQLVVLGIIGEYLGRTFIQTKQRPDYIVRERR